MLVKAALADIAYLPLSDFPDVRIPCFLPPFQFLFTILHLFREAWFERWIEMDQDVNLMKFADVVRLWQIHRKRLSSDAFIQMLEAFEVKEPVLWVLEHLDRTFHTDIVSALGFAGHVSEDWLSSARVSGGRIVPWQGTMRERLWRKDRRALFAQLERA